MSLIGTPFGVYKVGTRRRKPGGEQWLQEMIQNIAGSTQQLEPGVGTRRFNTFAKKKLYGETAGPPVTFQPLTDEAPVPRNHMFSSDVIKHGPTPNCVGCRAAAANKSWEIRSHR